MFHYVSPYFAIILNYIILVYNYFCFVSVSLLCFIIFDSCFTIFVLYFAVIVLNLIMFSLIVQCFTIALLGLTSFYYIPVRVNVFDSEHSVLPGFWWIVHILFSWPWDMIISIFLKLFKNNLFEVGICFVSVFSFDFTTKIWPLESIYTLLNPNFKKNVCKS